MGSEYLSNKLKLMLEERGISQRDLADMAKTSQQNLNNKIRRGLSISDFQTYAELLGYDLEIIIHDKETGKVHSENNLFNEGKEYAYDEVLKAVIALKEK
jgi:transcriptional regulator with XRE-family HTH domain